MPFDSNRRLVQVLSLATTVVLSVDGCAGKTWTRGNLEQFELAFDHSLVLDMTDLRPGWVGKEYSARLRATGQYKPYHWRVVDGHLPDGLSMDDQGVIEGTPEIPEVATFVVNVVGSTPQGSRSTFGLEPHVRSRMGQFTLVVKRSSPAKEAQ